MAYQLVDGVYFVKGAQNGTILDTLTGNVYSVNPQACRVLEYAVPDDSYWITLASMGLAVTTIQPRSPTLPTSDDLDRVRFVWFEVVSDDCNQRCIHCYGRCKPQQKRPMQPQMKHSDWQRVIREVYQLGCRRCQFIGGEPFLYGIAESKSVLDLARHAVEVGYDMVEIFTNGTLLTPDIVARMRDLNLRAAVSLYSSDATVHDAITQLAGSHALTIRGIEMLQTAGIHVRLGIPLMKQNQHTVADTIALKDRMGLKGRTPDPMRPVGRGETTQFQPDFMYLARYGLQLRPAFTAKLTTLTHNTSRHPCLSGKFVITEFGDVLPCVFSREQVVGNVLQDQPLAAVCANEPLLAIWRTTKQEVLVCRDCEYRYVCFDCRPLAYGAAEKKVGYNIAPYPRCTYNPYKGIWGEGLWKVGSDCVPYYDTGDAMAIRRARRTLNLATSEPI